MRRFAEYPLQRGRATRRGSADDSARNGPASSEPPCRATRCGREPRTGFARPRRTRTTPACDLALLGVPALAHLDHAHRRARHAGGGPRGAAALLDLRGELTESTSAELRAVDFGDVAEPGRPEGEARVRDARRGAAAGGCELLVALGGDNSITYPVMRRACSARTWRTCGLDHDRRASRPARRRHQRLAGAPAHRGRAAGRATSSRSASPTSRTRRPTRSAPREYGITVIPRAELGAAPAGRDRRRGARRRRGRRRGPSSSTSTWTSATARRCPAARRRRPAASRPTSCAQLAFLLGARPARRGIDITEIDATTDAPTGGRCGSRRCSCSRPRRASV